MDAKLEFLLAFIPVDLCHLLTRHGPAAAFEEGNRQYDTVHLNCSLSWERAALLPDCRASCHAAPPDLVLREVLRRRLRIQVCARLEKSMLHSVGSRRCRQRVCQPREPQTPDPVSGVFGALKPYVHGCRHVTLPDDISKRLAKDPNNNYVLMSEVGRVTVVQLAARDRDQVCRSLRCGLDRDFDLASWRGQNEWRSIGVQQSRGWVHYAIHKPEPHIMLFRYSCCAALPSTSGNPICKLCSAIG